MPAQARLVVRPAGQQHQHARIRDPVERQAEQLQGGGVDPVRVLENHQHRPAAREPKKLPDQCCQGAGALLLRASRSGTG